MVLTGSLWNRKKMTAPPEEVKDIVSRLPGYLGHLEEEEEA